MCCLGLAGKRFQSTGEIYTPVVCCQHLLLCHNPCASRPAGLRRMGGGGGVVEGGMGGGGG